MKFRFSNHHLFTAKLLTTVQSIREKFSVVTSSTVLWLCILLIATLTVLALTTKGKVLNETLRYQQGDLTTEPGSPFESTNTSSRYALVQAIVKRSTFELNTNEARLAAPDLVRVNERFFSIFNPGISFFAVPFYMLGEQFQMQQLFTFFSTALFAIGNLFMIFIIGKKLGFSPLLATISALIFLTATNGLAYANTLTQHHGSTFLILMGVYCVIADAKQSFRNSVFGIICGAALLFDFPNLFLLTPAGLMLLAQHVNVKQSLTHFTVSLRLAFILIALCMVPLLVVYGMYNRQTTGSSTRIAQFVGRSNYFDSPEEKARKIQNTSTEKDPFDTRLPFVTRLQQNGLYILLLSNERSWLYFSPVLLLGFIGAYTYTKEKKDTQRTIILAISIIATNFLIYSSFGDPWGGWSFGARYLIPSAAIASILVGLGLKHLGRHPIFIAVFVITLWQSIWISTAGALTSLAIPPKPESVAMVDYVPYTSDFNFKFLKEKGSSSLLYNAYFAPTLSATDFHRYLALITYAFILMLTTFLILTPTKKTL